MTITERVREYTRRLGLGDLRAPADDAEEYENVGGFQLPKDFHVISEKAQHLESLAQHPGWKLVLDELEKQADARLGVIKEAENADPVLCKAMMDRWREAEGRIRGLEKIVLDAIHERDAMLLDLSGKYGGETTDILNEANMIHQMKEQIHREGMIAIDPDDLEDM